MSTMTYNAFALILEPGQIYEALSFSAAFLVFCNEIA